MESEIGNVKRVKFALSDSHIRRKKKRKSVGKQHQNKMKKESLKDIANEIGYENLKKYLFPSRPLMVYDFDERNFIDDDILRRVKSAVFHEDIAKMSKNDTIENCADTKQPIDFVRLLRGPKKGSYLHRLSGEQVKPKQLRGKYVMICCLSVPDSVHTSVWTAVAAASEFYNTIPNFEMVIVARMRQGWSTHNDAFKDFLSGFPPSCLYVPFDSHSLRGLICYFVGIALMPLFLLFDPSGNLLLDRGLTSFSLFYLVPWYGSATQPFPFIRKFFQKLSSDDADHFKQPCSLQECFHFFLKVYSADYLPLIPVSNLNFKTVGIYLYRDGDLLPLVREIDQACKEHEKQLDIVVLHLPLGLCDDPSWFSFEYLPKAILRNNLQWSVAIFNFSCYAILNHFFIGGEKLLIVEPDVQVIEPRGADFFRVHGIDAYPFTESSGFKLEDT